MVLTFWCQKWDCPCFGLEKIEFWIRFDLDPFDFIIDVLVLLLLDIVLDIDLHCIYSYLICVCALYCRVCVLLVSGVLILV